METLGGTIVDSPKDSYRDLIIIGSKNGNSTDYNRKKIEEILCSIQKYLVILFGE